MNIFEIKVNEIFDKMLATMQERLPDRFPAKNRPRLVIGHKPCVTFLARAQFDRKHNLAVITYSDVYLDEMIKRKQFKITTYHELAHVVQFMYFEESRSHGREFQRIMYENGYPNEGATCLSISSISKREATRRGF